ncbi:hypothetical protein LEP1GSC035_2790 [Leptospira noguchii str. 2007001578]|uniref:Uncharacterized protein n=2 Tax=Leptospira noguchii TaxID=28182 RepID=M6Y2P7_9LEPT|nr:hypothetical protein LEP1GSC035_2790 [Leptospira noguchii str. 2007001578]EMO88587.1 hypothetical protein LEP1GSC024_0805 [Leptospira noguchii str. 2001034031]
MSFYSPRFSYIELKLVNNNFYYRHSIKDWIFEILICFMLSLLVGIWFEIKDSEPLKTLRIFWPILWKSHNYIKTLSILLYKKFV